jgi:stalled ribosome alternative rescue factor ArfA
MKIPRVNPVAKAMALNRRRKQIVPPKKGKGSYDKNKDKRSLQSQLKEGEET